MFCLVFVLSMFVFKAVGRAILIEISLLGKNIMSDVNDNNATGAAENRVEKKYIESKSSLVSRNITVMGRRTSVRLEPEMWSAMKNISKREECTIHDLCSLIALRKKSETSLTAAIRVFLMLYYRASSTENGHDKAGHGDFQNMKRRAGMDKDWSASKMKSKSLDVSDYSVEERLSPHLKAMQNVDVANSAAQQ